MIASVVVLSVGVLAAVRMQITAVATSRAPVANQEIATIARRALEEGVAVTRTINGYQVVVTVENCRFTGTTISCGGAGATHVQRLTTRVTSNVDGQVFEAVTFRAN